MRGKAGDNPGVSLRFEGSVQRSPVHASAFPALQNAPQANFNSAELSQSVETLADESAGGYMIVR